MQRHTSDNQTVDEQSASSKTAQQAQRQQLQVISPARTTVDLAGVTRQGIFYQEAMQNLQSPQSFPPLGSAANAINAQQQISDWSGDGRFVQQPVRYSSTLQPVYDLRGQLLTPGNYAVHPTNVNQIVQYAYSSPQQRPGQGPVLPQITPWQTVFTPNQGLTWVPGGIQAATMDGQGNQILNRNLQHDSPPGVYIQSGQSQLQQLKQMDGQHLLVQKAAINENFSPALPNSVTSVNSIRTQQQAQIQALQKMLQSHKVLTKNPVRLQSAATSHKNGGYHTATATSLTHPLPPVVPGPGARPAPSSNSQEVKRMKQAQAPEESPRKDLTMTLQQAQKRYKLVQGSPLSVSVPMTNSIPGTPEGVAPPVIPMTPLTRNRISESVTSAISTIHIPPASPMPQITLNDLLPVVAISEQQLEAQGDVEHKKRIQKPGSPVMGQNREEEPRGSPGELGGYVEEKSSSKRKTLPEGEVLYCEDADANMRGDRDNNGTTTSKATVLVKPQMMTHTTEVSFESDSSFGDCEDGQGRSLIDGKIFEDDDKEINTTANADSGKEGLSSSNKQQTKHLSKWTVADVYEFIKTVPGCSEYAEDFVTHDIDGEALMLLRTDHLVTAMSMTLGPAMKIISRVDALREDVGSPAK